MRRGSISFTYNGAM
ncbi:hypothetical protein RDI58_001180 [Solanum bulbocastanum]|uniref:Uncharacterized protein n=1 Tax=Solanum bulbocastanum TaxID=147425 RepID=A0AAN8UC87_SOLBU